LSRWIRWDRKSPAAADNPIKKDHACMFKSAYIALIGRPNAGKSTLLNTVLGEELSIVSPLPQTTRKSVKGIYNREDLQLVFLDTPGVHDKGHSFNEAMVRECRTILRADETDIVCYLVDLSREFGAEEDEAAHLVAQSRLPALLVFNKSDSAPGAAAKVESFIKRYPYFAETPRVVLSAIRPESRGLFLDAVMPLVPQGMPYFPPDDLTDASMRFFAAEYIRKHIILNTREEVPHASFVEITDYKETDRGHLVEATIHVESRGQRGIIIGKGGALIRKIRERAEKDLGSLARAPVTIKCHLTVTPKWRDDARFLREMGYR